MGFATRRQPTGTRLFFAADLHGSEPAWRKFVNAGRFYGVDALVFGGDLMGKALLPIVRWNGTLHASFEDRVYDLEPGPELDGFTAQAEVAGFYWRVMDPDENEALRGDPLLVEGLVQDLARERLRAWIAFADGRLAGTGIRMFLTGGNDDAPAVLSVLEDEETDTIAASEGRVVELDGEHTMITVGLSTPTPWDTAREASEEEIADAISSNLAGVPDPGRCVFNLHVPPKGTHLDRCLKVEAVPGELPKPVRVGGRFVTTSGGSTAVGEAIRVHQPAVALHGHIHESPGRIRIGRTPCFNPGSEYAQGRLEGVIVTICDGRVTSYQHTSG